MGRKFAYAPGLVGYGTQGADGSAGLQGLALYFSDYNGQSDTTAIRSKIIANKTLFSTTDELLPGYPERVYLTGDIFIDARGRVFEIDLNETNRYTDTGASFAQTSFFSTLMATPISGWTRVANPFGAGDQQTVDNVYTNGTPSSTVVTNLGNELYINTMSDFAQVNYADIPIQGDNSIYYPFLAFTGNGISPLGIVAESTGDVWHIGNLDKDGNQEAVDLALDFQQIKLGPNANITSSLAWFNLDVSITGDIAVQGDGIFNHIYANKGTFYDDVSINAANLYIKDGDFWFDGTNSAYTISIRPQGSGIPGDLSIIGEQAVAGTSGFAGDVTVRSGYVASGVNNGSGALNLMSSDAGNNTAGGTISGSLAGSINMSTGDGGDTNSVSSGSGGDAGDLIITLGDGGDTQGTTGSGGEGGSISIIAGDGGDTQSTTDNDMGQGGSILIQAGIAGTYIPPGLDPPTEYEWDGHISIVTGQDEGGDAHTAIDHDILIEGTRSSSSGIPDPRGRIRIHGGRNEIYGYDSKGDNQWSRLVWDSDGNLTIDSSNGSTITIGYGELTYFGGETYPSVFSLGDNNGSVIFNCDVSVGGRVNFYSNGTAESRSAPFSVATSATPTYTATFRNEGNSTSAYGISIMAGQSAPSARNYILRAYNGSDSERGGLEINSGNNFAIYNLSDERYKLNIKDTKMKALDIISNVPVRNYQWRKLDKKGNPTSKAAPGKINTGFIAQELEKFYPDAVTVDENDIYTISTAELIPVHHKGIQELNVENKYLKDRVKELEQLVEKLIDKVGI